MNNRYGHHHMMGEREKQEFHAKYGRANFSKPGSRAQADIRIELAELRKKVRKLEKRVLDPSVPKVRKTAQSR